MHNNKIKSLICNLNPILSNDLYFAKYWENIRTKGIIKFAVKNAIIGIITMVIIGAFFTIKNLRFLGYEKEKIFLVTVIFGFALGITNSLLAWIVNNNRFNKLK